MIKQKIIVANLDTLYAIKYIKNIENFYRKNYEVINVEMQFARGGILGMDIIRITYKENK